VIGEESPFPVVRTVALILWLAYSAAALLWHGLLIGVETFAGCGFLNACIWFPEVMGEKGGLRTHAASDPSILSAVAWFLLLLPLAILIIQKVSGYELGL
jgi:hypothetical protein